MVGELFDLDAVESLSVPAEIFPSPSPRLDLCAYFEIEYNWFFLARNKSGSICCIHIEPGKDEITQLREGREAQ